MTWARFAALLSFLVIAWFGFNEARAQTTNTAYAESYFLGGAPTEADLSKWTPPRREVIVAKVRVTTVAWRGGRHNWDAPPNSRHGAMAVIVEVLSGKAAVGARINVVFGFPGSAQKYIYPRTPKMRAREYFVAFYVDENNEFRLIGFPVGQAEYEQWDREFWKYERERNRPGARDR